MRTLIWLQGLLILTAWHSIAANVLHTVPAAWWAWSISWGLFWPTWALVSVARWAIRKAKAGDLAGFGTTVDNAPAGK